MKIRIETSWLALAGLLLAAPALADNETNGPAGPPKDLGEISGSIPQIEAAPVWSVPAELPQVPATLPIYEMTPKDPLQPGPVAEALFQRLQFDGTLAGVDEDDQGVAAAMYVDAENRSVELFRSGALFYMEEDFLPESAPDLLSTLQLDPQSAEDVFAGEGAAFLESIGLERPGMRFKDVSFAELKTVQDGGTQESTKVVAAAAHFGYEVDGVPAWGPGAKTTVYFGQNGPTGFYDAMRDLEPAGEVELFSPAQAVAGYIEGGDPRSLLRLHTGVVDETVIEEVKLVYYVEPGNADQTWLEPWYQITGTMYGWNPGPDPRDPRAGATEAEPAPFTWLQRASEPVPEPGFAGALALGALALARVSGRRRRRGTALRPMA